MDFVDLACLRFGVYAEFEDFAVLFGVESTIWAVHCEDLEVVFLKIVKRFFLPSIWKFGFRHLSMVRYFSSCFLFWRSRTVNWAGGLHPFLNVSSFGRMR
jgi:hypothetical protein